MPLNRVFVVGVGMTPFTKPKKDPADGPHYPELAQKAVERAIADACIDKAQIQQAFVGNMVCFRFVHHRGFSSLLAAPAPMCPQLRTSPI
jgi:acetyl-CoA acetyltransferase